MQFEGFSHASNVNSAVALDAAAKDAARWINQNTKHVHVHFITQSVVRDDDGDWFATVIVWYSEK